MFRGQLYDFQQQAADQLLEWNGGLLSLSMGLGKTPVSIYIAETLLDAEQAEIALVVVPPNLRRQWQNEIKKFAPDATVTLVEGPPKKRAEQYGWAYERAEYLIVGYPALLNDWEHLTDFPTDLVIADECQAVKNFRAKRTKKLKKLGGDFRLGLTGHPLENRPEDIYSIVEWVDPSLLGRFDLFDRTYIVRDDWGRPVRYRNLDHLAARLRGSVMVRTSRADVADQLPERVEQDLDIDLDPATDRVYRWVVDDLLGWLDRAAESGGSGFDLDAAYGRTDAEDDSWHIRGSIAARMLALRMLCDHPRLIEHSADKFVSTLGDHGSEYLLSLRESVDLAKLKTPKFDATIDLIRTISEEAPGNKIALFSFFKGTLGWFQEALADLNPVLYTGDVDPREKQAAVDAFNNDPGVRVFLSSDAGGAGVNLPAGNFHINFNLPFSAGQLAQRNARLDRISSQHQRLTILNILTAGTIETFYREILRRRQILAEAVLDQRANGAARPPKRSVDMDLGSLRAFLLDM